MLISARAGIRAQAVCIEAHTIYDDVGYLSFTVTLLTAESVPSIKGYLMPVIVMLGSFINTKGIWKLTLFVRKGSGGDRCDVKRKMIL